MCRRGMIVILTGMMLSLGGCVLRGPQYRDQVFEAFNTVGKPLPDKKIIAKDYTPEDLSTMPQTDTRWQLRKQFLDYEVARGRKPAGDGSLVRANNNDDATKLRNMIAESVITNIKLYHEGTSDDVFEATSLLETAFDFAGLALGGAGAVTGSASTKAALAAASAGTIGSRASLTKNILADQAKMAVIDQMAALRLSKEAEIRVKLRDRTNDDYQLEACLNDLFDYFNSGSLKDAVAAMVRSAQHEKTEALKQVKKANEPAAKSSTQSQQTQPAKTQPAATEPAETQAAKPQTAVAQPVLPNSGVAQPVNP